jgi:5-carboxymethyl-2-hydroxymuconate isomerase
VAHFIIEYSANLAPELDVPALFEALMKTARATGVFPLGGIRFRAVRCDDYLIADGNPANGFAHLSVKMGHGRPAEVRRDVGEKLFAALCAFLDPIFRHRPLGISMEVVELDPVLSFKKNNMHGKPV